MVSTCSRTRNDSAQNNLGYAYDKGEGVAQDYKTAVKWYRLAQNKGMLAHKLIGCFTL